MQFGVVKPPGSDDSFQVEGWRDGTLADLPDEHRKLLESTATAVVATHNESGTINLSPIWVAHDGTHVLLNSARGRLKDRNVRARSNVSICVMDPENPYHYLSIIGEVTEIVDEDDPERGAESTDMINAAAQRYMGVDEYNLRPPGGEVRSLYYITPTKVTAFGE